MKKQIMKLGMVAALVMGGAAAANADTTVTFKGEVAKGTCDTVLQNGSNTVNLPTLLPTDFPTTPGASTKAVSSPITINFTNCHGDDVAANDFLTMRALPVATQDNTLTTNNLWGDRALGWGIQLEAKAVAAGLPNSTTPKRLTPNDNLIQITEATVAATSMSDMTPSPVMVVADMTSYVPQTNIVSGINTAVVEFSSVYN